MTVRVRFDPFAVPAAALRAPLAVAGVAAVYLVTARRAVRGRDDRPSS